MPPTRRLIVADPSTYEVWIPGSEWSRVQPLIEPLNTLDGSMLRLPVTPFPATFAENTQGDIVLSGEANWWVVDDWVGKTIRDDVFDKDGWTPEKFGQFVASRRSTQVMVDGETCPTIVAVAAYVRSRMLVVHHTDDRCWISFVSGEGDASVAEYTGDQDGIQGIWSAYLSRGVDYAMKRPGLSRRTYGDTLAEAVERRAAMRQQAIREWQYLHGTRMRLAPPGAELTAYDIEFTPRDDIEAERPVIAHARTSKHVYELIYPLRNQLRNQRRDPLKILCAVDGVLREYIDPATGEPRGLGATCADWAEWILKDSVAGDHPARGKLWEGAGADAELYRLSKNIVQYEEHEANTSQFTTTTELQAWLNKAQGNNNAPLGVHLIDDGKLIMDDKELPFVQNRSFDQSESDQVRVSYFARVFEPWEGVSNWLNPSDGGYSRYPVLHVDMEGQTIDAFKAVNCLDALDLQDYVPKYNFDVREGAWFMLWLEDTRTCIVFPAEGTTLVVTTDNDGASVSITAREQFSRGAERRQELGFEIQWEKWLDDGRPLTREDIKQGLAVMGQLIEEINA